jgi:hypothetical protein
VKQQRDPRRPKRESYNDVLERVLAEDTETGFYVGSGNSPVRTLTESGSSETNPERPHRTAGRGEIRILAVNFLIDYLNGHPAAETYYCAADSESVTS